MLLAELLERDDPWSDPASDPLGDIRKSIDESRRRFEEGSMNG